MTKWIILTFSKAVVQMPHNHHDHCKGHLKTGQKGPEVIRKGYLF